MKNMLSIIITTRNEEDVLGDLLDSLKKQSKKGFEIIVVDNNSIDETKDIARKYKCFVFDKGPERSVQRNFGVRKASGKYVLILDADMRLHKNAVKECLEMAKNINLGGLVIPEKSFGVGFWAKCRAFEREFYLGDENIECPRFFKKSIFQKFGGYDSRITGPEDYDLPLRMKKGGIRFGRIKSYILHNEKRFSPLKSMKKKFYYASHAKQYLKKHPEMLVVQGNLIFRPAFWKNYKKLIRHPVLTAGTLIIKSGEMLAGLAGLICSVIIHSDI